MDLHVVDLGEGVCRPVVPYERSGGWRSQYMCMLYHFCDRYKTLSGHIWLTKMIHNKNSSATDRGAAP